MFYNARWYDPAIGRFAQADTIIPPGTQGMDRYAYVNNNPSRYTDPIGHCAGDPDDPKNPDAECWDTLNQITSTYDFITIKPENWTNDELLVISDALLMLEAAFGSNENLHDAVGNVTLERVMGTYIDDDGNEFAAFYVPLGNTITFYDGTFNLSKGDAIFTTLHEFGHAFDNKGFGMKSDKFEDTFWDNCLSRLYPNDGCQKA